MSAQTPGCGSTSDAEKRRRENEVHDAEMLVRLTDAERKALAAGWPDFWKVHAAVERILAARIVQARAGCLVPCDTDCEATCHAAHLPRHKRVGESALREALSELVALKDGPRDAAYRATKEGAWDRARAALAETDRP